MRLGKPAAGGGSRSGADAPRPDGDPRLMRRREEMEAATVRAGRTRLLLAAAAIAAVLGLGWLFFFSGLFALSDLKVEASGKQVPVAEVQRAAQAYLGTNFFRFDSARLVRTLESDPIVGSVRVRESFPHTIVVEVGVARPVLLLSPVTGSAGGVAVNARLQPMPGVAPTPGLVPACLAAVPFSGSSTDFACDHGATVAELSPALERVLVLLGATRAANLNPTSAVVFAGFGVGIGFAGGYGAYFPDGSGATTAVLSLAGLVKQGLVHPGAVVDLTDPTHPVVD
ncbi:MAG: FtsQ-type POTRA domain-containing protein [Actinomycetota bacterium]|nr:FtsQ-type POTRA domain-containing protein [Actinomycetota bacterium]